MTHTNHSSAVRNSGLAISLLSLLAGCVGSTEPPTESCDDCGGRSGIVHVPDRPSGLDITPRLDVSVADATLAATLSADTLRVRRGTETAIEVTVDRGDFEGEVAVWVDGLPQGVRADTEVLASTASSGRIAIVATELATEGGPQELRVLVGSVGAADPIEIPARIVVAGFPGRLDESFAEGGLATVSGRAVDFDQVAVDSQARVIVAGRDVEADSLFLERLSVHGAVDESYDGVVAALPEGMPARASRMVLDGDDARVLVTAGDPADSNVQIGLAVFDANGRLDDRVGTAGIVPVRALGTRSPRSLGLAVGEGSVFFRVDERLAALRSSGSVVELTLPDGVRQSATMAYGDHTLTFGVFDAETDRPAMLERVHTAGGRDERFGEAGVVRGVTESEVMLESATVQVVLAEDGSGYAAGNRSFHEAPTQGVVTRFTADGAIDPGFADEGRLTFEDERVHATVLDARGGVVVLTEHWPSFERRIWRFTASGALDVDFGLGGFIELGAVAPGAIAALAHDPIAERLVACGPMERGWRCARFWL